MYNYMGYDNKVVINNCGCKTITETHDFFNDSTTYTQLCNSCKVQSSISNQEIINKNSEKNAIKNKLMTDEFNLITHVKTIPMKIAMDKFRLQTRSNFKGVIFENVSDKKIRNCLINTQLKDLLLFEKNKNKWTCSSERLEHIDFTKFVHLI